MVCRLSRTVDKEMDAVQLTSEAATCKDQIGMGNVKSYLQKERIGLWREFNWCRKEANCEIN